MGSFVQRIDIRRARYWRDEDARSALLKERREHRMDEKDQDPVRSKGNHEPGQGARINSAAAMYIFYHFHSQKNYTLVV